MAFLIFAGNDATAEFDRIHPHNVVEKYAPDAIIGVVGSGNVQKVKGAENSDLIATEKGDAVENLEAWRDWRTETLDDTPGVLSVNVRFYVKACYYLVLSISYEICATIFSAKISTSRLTERGLRSACFLICFSVVHAVENLHVFKGPDDSKGYDYFYVRLYWTGFGFQANIVAEYVLLSAVLHILLV